MSPPSRGRWLDGPQPPGQHRPPHAAAPRVAPRPNVVEGPGHYIDVPTSEPHRCQPPLAHIGCCDGTGGSTITEESTRHPTHAFPKDMIGQRTVCIDGVPTGGPMWVCGVCGTGWKVGDACDACRHGGHGNPPRGLCTVGVKWVAMSRRETRRVIRRARRRG